jgi:type II secretory pathway pseudopilin PulG
VRNNFYGFGLIEIILAIGIWVILISSGSVMLVGSLKTNRLADEVTAATNIASEGLDALKAIKKQGWTTPFLSTSCIAGCGLATVSGTWGYGGVSNVIGKFTRQVYVEEVQRNGSGEIVNTGGTVDSDTYKARSVVTWSPGGLRNNTITLYTYLTNYIKDIVTSALGGLLIYGDGTTTPKYRSYDKTANSFSGSNSTVIGASGNSFVMRTSPLSQVAVAGYVTSGGTLYIMCFDGVVWSNEFNVIVGGNASGRRFDIAFETNTGDAMVLYSANTATTNELAYRTKSGGVGCGSANWSPSNSLNPVRTSGVIHWVEMAWDKRSSSNLISAIWADANSDLSAMTWSGTAWANEPSAALATTLEIVATSHDVDDFEVEYESTSGDLMVMFALAAGSNGTNGVRYATCTGGISSCTWSAVLTPATLSDDSTNMDLSADPDSDAMQFASVGNAGSDLQRCYWSGTAFTCNANVDTSSSTPVAGSKLVATAWFNVGGTKRSVIVYDDLNAQNIGWYACTTSTCTLQPDFITAPAINATHRWYQGEMDPVGKDQVMFLISANTTSFYSKRLVMNATPTFTWSNSDASTAIVTSLPQIITSPYSFAYWRQ